MKSKETIERIYITKDDFIKLENNVRFQEHLKRYAAVRRFCFGSVLDFACGCGYGTFILAVNPEITSVTGIDADEHAVEWARSNFDHPKIQYRCESIDSLQGEFDTLVCLETIEHLDDVSLIQNLVSRCKFKSLIISFPDKKSTHFNKFHYHDFVMQDLLDMFPDYLLYHQFKFVDVQFVLMVPKPAQAPHHIFRNLHDLR